MICELECKGCRHRVEFWVPLYSQREERAKEAKPCTVCGENSWHIVPSRFTWGWGAAIRTGGEK